MFLVEAHDLGVRSVHVSDEYESWPLFLQSLTAARNISATIDFRFIAKLAVPHFSQPSFDSQALQHYVEKYCSQLGIECLDDVQWMWRADLSHDAKRCADFVSQENVIRETVEQLKRNQRIRRFLCFPYSSEFATDALNCSFVDGLTIYRNSQERAYEVNLQQCQKKSKIAHVIRPFLSGATLCTEEAAPRQQLIKALDHPAIETAILSTGNLAHLRELLMEGVIGDAENI